MIQLILQTTQLFYQSDIVFWVVGIIIVLLLAVLFFFQRKAGKKLRVELEQLSKLTKQNVEYEFVLKAMRLATWHVDPVTRVGNYDYDFRDQRNLWLPQPQGEDVVNSSRQLVAEDAARVAKSLEDICTGRIDEYHEQYRVMIPHTNKFYWEESFAIVTKRDADGHPTSIVGTSMRIDERKSMEEALVQARNKAEESDRLKSAFIANMSHEIRTPLNAIIGFTSVLPDIEQAEERRQLINLIQENNQKLLRIIDDVMNISKIEAGNDQLTMTNFDLNTILTQATDKYAPKAQTGVTFGTQYAKESLFITTDMVRVQTIIDHLLSNAVKFTMQGTVTVGYDIPNDGRIHIWVKDTGKGVLPELQERIFERFYKVDEFVPGAGLGLSLCRTLAYSLGGNVGVESKVGEGSTFWLDLPV